MADINITPFTDVLLVLLIIFMSLAAIGVPPGFQKGFPTCCHGTHGTVRAPIRVEIASGPRFFLDGHRVAGAQLYRSMALAVERARSDPAHYTDHIELTGSASVPYDAIVKVLDAGRQAGDDDVGLIVY